MDTKKLRQKILDLAIHGKLVPQDPNDEPASDLLKRLGISPDNCPCEDLPNGWENCRIEQIAQVSMGQSPESGSVNSVEGLEFHQGKLAFGDIYLNYSEVYTTQVTKIAPAYSVVLCVRAPVGIPNITERKICIGRGLCAISSQVLSNKYLYYSLKTKQSYFESNATGSTFMAISGSIIKDTPICVPPLAEQKRIVSAVEQWMSVIDVLENNEEDLRQSIDKAKSKILDLAIHGKLVPQDPNDEPASDLLKRLGISPDNCPCEDLPKGWKCVKLEKVCSFESGYAFSKESYKSTGVPLVRISNIKDGFVDIEECVYVDPLEDSRFVIKKDDLLIAMSGATTGKMGVYKSCQPALLNQRVGNIKSKNINILTLKYRNYCLKLLQNRILKDAYGGAQPNISAKAICEYEINLPPLAEQHRIVAKIEQLFSQLDEIKSAL